MQHAPISRARYQKDPAYALELLNSVLADGNPALSSFRAILDAMGLRLAVEPKRLRAAH